VQAVSRDVSTSLRLPSSRKQNKESTANRIDYQTRDGHLRGSSGAVAQPRPCPLAVAPRQQPQQPPPRRLVGRLG
jgi:hypothetical protein